MRARSLSLVAIFLVSACGGSASTLPSSRSARGLSAVERRMLEVLPDDVAIVAVTDVARLRADATLEPWVEAWVGPTALASSVTRVAFGVGNYVRAERLCLGEGLGLREGGCPAAMGVREDSSDDDASDDEASEEEASEEELTEEELAAADAMESAWREEASDEEDDVIATDPDDALDSLRSGDERLVPALYAVFHASADACARFVGEGSRVGTNTVRVANGAALVDFGGGLCGFSSSSLVDGWRAPGSPVGAAAQALERGDAPLEGSMLDVGVAPALLEAFYMSYYDARARGYEFRLDQMTHSARQGLVGISASLAPRESGYFLRGDLHYRNAEQAIGGHAAWLTWMDREEAMRPLFQMVGMGAAPPNWSDEVAATRRGAVATFARALDAGTLSAWFTATFLDTPAPDAHPSEEFAYEERVGARYRDTFDRIHFARPVRALALVDEALADPGLRDEDIAALLRVERAQALFDAGRFREATDAAWELIARFDCSRVDDFGPAVAFGAPFVRRRLVEIVLVSEFERHDATGWSLAMERLANAPACFSEESVMIRLPYLFDLLSGHGLGHADPDATPPPAELDRLPDVEAAAGQTRLAALARRHRFADIVAIVDHHFADFVPGPCQPLAAFRAYAAIELGHPREVLEGPRQLAGPEESCAPADQAWGPASLDTFEPTVWRSGANRAWLLCRAHRRADGDARAVASCRSAVELAVDAYGPAHPRVARAGVELAEALRGARDRAGSRAAAQAALAALANVHESHPLLATARALAR